MGNGVLFLSAWFFLAHYFPRVALFLLYLFPVSSIIKSFFSSSSLYFGALHSACSLDVSLISVFLVWVLGGGGRGLF